MTNVKADSAHMWTNTEQWNTCETSIYPDILNAHVILIITVETQLYFNYIIYNTEISKTLTQIYICHFACRANNTDGYVCSIGKGYILLSLIIISLSSILNVIMFLQCSI